MYFHDVSKFHSDAIQLILQKCKKYRPKIENCNINARLNDIEKFNEILKIKTLEIQGKLDEKIEASIMHFMDARLSLESLIFSGISFQ